MISLHNSPDKRLALSQSSINRAQPCTAVIICVMATKIQRVLRTNITGKEADGTAMGKYLAYGMRHSVQQALKKLVLPEKK